MSDATRTDAAHESSMTALISAPAAVTPEVPVDWTEFHATEARNSVRGLLIGLLIAIPFWAIIGGVVAFIVAL